MKNQDLSVILKLANAKRSDKIQNQRKYKVRDTKLKERTKKDL